WHRRLRTSCPSRRAGPRRTSSVCPPGPPSQTVPAQNRSRIPRSGPHSGALPNSGQTREQRRGRSARSGKRRRNKPRRAKTVSNNSFPIRRFGQARGGAFANYLRRRSTRSLIQIVNILEGIKITARQQLQGAL